MAIKPDQVFGENIRAATSQTFAAAPAAAKPEPIRVAEFSLTNGWSSDIATRALQGPAYTSVGGRPVGSTAVSFDPKTGASGVRPIFITPR